MIEIPQAFATDTIDREGQAGREWIDTLPSVVEHLCERWRLVPDGEPMHGYLGIAVPVRRGAEPCVLKVSWIDEWSEHEALALSVWDGDGAVRLLDNDEQLGALLLERLDPNVTLGSLPMDQAVPVAADLLRRLSRPGVPGPPRVRDVAAQWRSELDDRWQRLDGRMARRTVEAAVDACAQLGPSSGDGLVNQDLHYDNVLSSTREPWLVIDPKPVIGDPEFAVAPLLWSRPDSEFRAAAIRRRLDLIVDIASLDPARAAGWCLARVVDFRLWGLSLGYTEGPARCAVLAEALTAWDRS